MDEFVHLHVHTHKGSLLDGHGTSRTYAERAALLGQPALALTDHGSLSGAYEHWKACSDYEIKPIIGCEFYVAPDDRTLKKKVTWGPGEPGRVAEDGDSPGLSGSGSYTHLTVLARSSEGVRNLYRLQASGHDSGFYSKSRIDLGLLADHSEGLIVLSGCAGSALSTRLRLGQRKEADALTDAYRSIFKDDFFVEVMHHGIPFEDALNRDLIELAGRHNVPLVATNDAHYCGPEQKSVHAALLCVQTQSTLAKPAFSFSGEGYYLRSRREMESLPLPAVSVANSLLVADRVEKYSEVFDKTIRFPRYNLPDGWDSVDALWYFCCDSGRIDVTDDKYYSQLKYEHKVICDMGYPDYFLVLYEIMKEARKRGIVFGPGRGSAGGSLVAFALGITDLDPIVHGLVFERFLNPQRVSMPDIDIDVSESQRDDLIAVARELYGEEFVAHIGTFGTIGAKAALKDANRVLGGSPAQGDARSAMLPPPKFGRAPGIEDYTGPRDELYEVASQLYGTIRNEGVHAAGIVISPDPLRDLVPMRKLRDKEKWPSGDGPWVIGLSDKEVEAIGLVKMDFLGLRNLGIIDETLRMLGGRVLPLPTLPRDCNDSRTYGLLSSGDTLGVFQLDSPGMRGLLRLLQPTRFDDISAVLALYRPGPMGAKAHLDFAHRKNDGVEWRSDWAIHPELEEALKPALAPSFGLIVWQEQVLEVLKIVCGWSYAEAGLLFDAMRKKNHEKMAATKPSYYSAGKAKGYSEAGLDALWETLVPFADYSFNRAHSAGYGLVAYWTAYLKANHPIQYMSALLSSVAEDPNKLPEYLAEVERLGIPLLPPDINRSGVGFSPGDVGIHYGIGAIKGVGQSVFKAVASKRPYASVDDFFMRAPAKALNTGSLAALIGSGTLDELSDLREELYVAREALSARALLVRQEARAGQRPLYRLSFSVGASGLRSTDQRQEWERAYLSTVLTQGVIELVPARPLGESELHWLRDLLSRNPGKTALKLRIGRVSLELPSANWPAVEQAVASLGAFQ